MLLKVESSAYKTIKERQLFYKKADKLFAKIGYEVRWLKAASKTVKLIQIAYSKWGGFFANTNTEIRIFFETGNQRILYNSLLKIRDLWRSGEVLKGVEALRWDAQILADEQALIQTDYERLTKKSQDILAHNLKSWISKWIFRNPSFDGHVTDIKSRWVFGMKKMNYAVTPIMMPVPNLYWKQGKLGIVARKGAAIEVEISK